MRRRQTGLQITPDLETPMPELQHLSDLDRAAVMAYEQNMGRSLSDPGRLKAVYSAKFAAEPVRDRLALICDTGKRMLGADGCEVNLITDTEQLDVVSGTSGDVHEGFCRFVVNERAPMGVEEGRTHALVCTTRAVTEKGIRSYLGLPLLWDAFAVGAFCVYSYEPRTWRPHEVQVLAGLAATVVDTLHWDDDKS